MKIIASLLAGLSCAVPENERLITDPANCCQQLKLDIRLDGVWLSDEFHHGRDSTICEPSIEYNGRWLYDCKAFGGALKDVNHVSIVPTSAYKFSSLAWIIMKGTVQDFLRYGSGYGPEIDSQHTDDSSVCIDHDASARDVPGYEDDFGSLFSGNLKCLDPDKTTIAPIAPCAEALAFEKLVGPGTFECETKNGKRGVRKICTAKCDHGRKPKGPKKTRCKQYDNRNGIAYRYWHTTKKNKLINCN